MHQRNKKQDKKIDTQAQPTAYLEGSRSSLGVRILATYLSERETFLDVLENPLCLTGQKSSPQESRGMSQVMA